MVILQFDDDDHGHSFHLCGFCNEVQFITLNLREYRQHQPVELL